VLDRARALYHLALTELDRADPQEQDTARWLAISDRLGLVSVFDGARADLPVFERGVSPRARAGPAGLLVARAEHSLGYVLYALGESAACITHIERARAGRRPGRRRAGGADPRHAGPGAPPPPTTAARSRCWRRP
jgi:hypothetical protein